MSRQTMAMFALVCATLATVVVCRTGPVRSPLSTPSRSLFASRWKTEQEWLVDFILRDLAGIATYASTGRAPAAQDFDLHVDQEALGSVHVRASLTLEAGRSALSLEQDLRLEPHLWASEPYVGIAGTLLGSAHTPSVEPAGTQGSESRRLLAALLDPRSSTLLRENRALSARLRANPRDAAAHEEAALLLAAFAMREASGWFYDDRLELARATTHLAVARTLSPGAGLGLVGRYAEAIVVAAVCRQADLLARLADLERGANGAPEEEAWIRALRIRSTSDWRVTRDRDPLSLLEKREEFGAMLRAVDQDGAVELLDRRGADEVPDWARFLTSWGVSVGTGHRFVPTMMSGELQEVREGWASLRDGSPPEGAGLVRELNAVPGGLVSGDPARPTVSVLGWGQWAAFEQRHILHTLHANTRFLADNLGLKEDADDFAKRGEEQFGGLALYPVELVARAKDAPGFGAAEAAFAALASQSPERLPGGCWYRARMDPDFKAPPPLLPDEDSWFRPPLISGTLYEFPFRLRLRDLVHSSPDERRRLLDLAPYEQDLINLDLDATGGLKRPLTEVVAAFGPTLEYDARAMDQVAQAAWDDPTEFEKRQGTLCRLIPERCFLLAWRLADLGEAEKARAAYQDGFDRARDSVTASANARFLVDYYFDHGQKERALQIAETASETYSGAGLHVMAHLQERMGHLQEAEAYYERRSRRYDKKEGLLGFLYRQARVSKNPTYERRFQAVLREMFPKGLEELDRSKLPAKPKDGVLITNDSKWTRRFGIKQGAVVVGLDGFRVRTMKEYEAVHAFGEDPPMDLLVWQGASYQDIRDSLWDRELYARLDDFKPAY